MNYFLLVKLTWIRILFSLIVLNSEAQNLISDPGFEMVNRFKDGNGTIYQYEHWHSLLSLKKLSPEGLPIFSVYSRHHMANRYIDWWTPFEGDSYMFSHYVYLRNLYQTTLIRQLERGKVYKVNFKYKVVANSFSNEKEEESINDKLGVMFTTKDMTDSAGIEAVKNLSMIMRPQLPLQTYTGDNMGKWLDFTYYIKAEKSFQYCIIGNFQKLIESYELKYVPVTGIGYRIDNVSVEQVDESERISQIMAKQVMQEKKFSKNKRKFNTGDEQLQ